MTWQTLKKDLSGDHNLNNGRCFLAKFDGQVVKMTYIVAGRFIILDVEVVWKPYMFVGIHLLNQYIQAYEV